MCARVWLTSVDGAGESMGGWVWSLIAVICAWVAVLSVLLVLVSWQFSFQPSRRTKAYEPGEGRDDSIGEGLQKEGDTPQRQTTQRDNRVKGGQASTRTGAAQEEAKTRRRKRD